MYLLLNSDLFLIVNWGLISILILLLSRKKTFFLHRSYISDGILGLLSCIFFYLHVVFSIFSDSLIKVRASLSMSSWLLPRTAISSIYPSTSIYWNWLRQFLIECSSIYCYFSFNFSCGLGWLKFILRRTQGMNLLEKMGCPYL